MMIMASTVAREYLKRARLFSLGVACGAYRSSIFSRDVIMISTFGDGGTEWYFTMLTLSCGIKRPASDGSHVDLLALTSRVPPEDA